MSGEDKQKPVSKVRIIGRAKDKSGGDGQEREKKDRVIGTTGRTGARTQAADARGDYNDGMRWQD